MTRKINQRSSTPESMKKAKARVVSAIVESETIIISLRLTRSAQTPAKIETMACGRKPKTAAKASTNPDLVVSVRCHKSAYWTNREPKVEMVWPTRNTVTRLFQPGISSLGVEVAVDSLGEDTCCSFNSWILI
jgi:hypothetical protein